jgi:hypothetical protein
MQADYLFGGRGVSDIALVSYYVFCPCRSGEKPVTKKRYTLLFAMPDIGCITLGAWE